MEPADAQPAHSSSLSSLAPSPDRALSSSPPRKRPRLSSASPPPPALPLPQSPQKHHAHLQPTSTAFDDLLDGLGDDDFRMLPSSDPAAARVDDHAPDEPADDPQVHEGNARNTTNETELSAGEDVTAGAADDSGLGLLPDVEQDKDGAVEDIEFEGDDMWLELDTAAVGFDQPDTFPSSALSMAPLKADKGKGKAVQRVSVEEDDVHMSKEEPRLSDFGFASVDPMAAMSGGGFVFATRKPLVFSDKALQRARALLEAEESDSAPGEIASTTSSTSASTTPAPRPAFDRPSAIPVASTSRPASPAAQPSAAPPPAFFGFANAAGRALQMPSEEALQRARERLAVPDSSPQNAPERVKNPLRPLARSAMPPRDVFEGSPAPARALPSSRPSSAFALAPPLPRPNGLSALALEQANGLASAFDSPTAMRTRPTSAASSAGKSAGSGGRRTPLLPVNGHAGAVVEANDEEKASSTTLQSSSPSARAPSPPPPVAAPSDVPPLALGGAAAPPLPALIAPVPVRPAAGLIPRTAGRSAAPTRPVSFRPPMLSSTSTPARPSITSTPLRPTALASASTSQSPFPAAMPNPLHPQHRRLNLGMTPRNKPFHLANTRGGTPGASAGARGARTGVKAFVTPFKGGRRPEGLTPMGLKDKVGATPATGGKESARKGGESARKAAPTPRRPGKADEAKRERLKVFDLEALAGERHKLGEFGMLPQTHFHEYLAEIGVPKEVLDMDSTSGATHTFPCSRGVADAFAALQALVAERAPEEKDLVTLPWVKNHWALILWKVASYVRSRPDLLGDWWTFERTMEQLRYRYEREINRAERSAIKRVQERDSPASLPMVLCVSQIRWDDPPEDADNGTLVIVGLELTDGWYRIRTNVDKTLKSACERGKIVVGSKIAVMGAKLDSIKSEGSEVLQALNSSTLVISGNSTSLAPWHATLGFHREPFVASLSSLSSNGGLVPLVDIVIDRAFPCGYIDLRKGRGTETWGEEEEQTRAEEWKRGRKRIEVKMSEEAEKAGMEEDEVVELLQEAASMLEIVSDRAPPPSTPPEEPDEILDRLEDATNKRALIRKLSPAQVRATLALAVENARESRFRAVDDLQKELAEKYPPREVRGFRVLRVSDAREGTKGAPRTALLTVWDAQGFAEGFFREGTRYLISNTMPKGSWRSQDREVALSTRRDSRWRKM
ncbi:hypothetical protein JCM10450v2_002514 [Rhodotorula kratochvilovae]